MNQWDYETMRRTLYGEARNQKFEEIVAIAWVIKNRALIPGPTWWGDSIAEVCLAPMQFSCWNKDDPNRKVIIRVQEGEKRFELCSLAARVVLEDVVPDPTSGATHYHTVAKPNGTKTWPPAWVKGMEPRGQVGGGAHLFYKGR
jgi:N-acetylmuramoyl-L-alanine amidase